MPYLKWDEKIITDFSDSNINSLYNQGYVFTRQKKGSMNQTRSLRIDLEKFELSSENRRVLRKTEEVKMETSPLPLKSPPLLGEGPGAGYYDWTIGKLGKDFYDTKFGDKTPAPHRSGATGAVFSANKIKELMTEVEKSNFNVVLVYKLTNAVGDADLRPLHDDDNVVGVQKFETLPRANINSPLHETIGYVICYQNPAVLHYCYPFYRLSPLPFPLSPNTGLGMMLKAIVWAKENNKKYFYLGSFQRPSDTYKLQFAGLEWWDGKEWKNDLDELKNMLKNL